MDRSIEPRLNQIFVPLLSIIEDAKARDDLRELARQINRQLVDDRGMDTEAHILAIIKDLLKAGEALSVKSITSWFADRHTEDYERKVTPKWIGTVIRKRLHLITRKSHGIFVIPEDEYPKLARLYEKYSVGEEDEQPNAKAASEASAADG